MPRLDFHAALNAPAVSRYGATAPELLRWFDGYNADRPYRDQVKPFGFLLSLRAKRILTSKESINLQPRRGRPPKVAPPKPVAPFETDKAKIAATAFDRESGQPVPSQSLQTYREAIAQYHLHPESKFYGGDYCDRGTTQRRHIHGSGIWHIGKEANELQRQQILGADADLDLDYGLADFSLVALRRDLAALADTVGNAGAAKSLRMAPRRLVSLLAGKFRPDEITSRALSARLAAAKMQAKIADAERHAELWRHQQMREKFGLRGAARRLGVDPSNLRRQLRRKAN